MTKEELLSYKVQTGKIRTRAELNAERIRKEHEDALLLIQKKCKEFSELIKELAIKSVRIDTGIRYNGEPIILVIHEDAIYTKIKNPALFFDNEWRLCYYLPGFDRNEQSRVIYRFIEMWDEAEITRKVYEKASELLEKERGEACARLEDTKRASTEIRVTEIYRNGELVSRKEEAI